MWILLHAFAVFHFLTTHYRLAWWLRKAVLWSRSPLSLLTSTTSLQRSKFSSSWLDDVTFFIINFFMYYFFNINFQHVQFFGEEVDGPLYTRDVSFPTCNQNDVTYSNPYSSFLVLRCQLYLINVILWPKLYQWSSEIYISSSTIKS